MYRIEVSFAGEDQPRHVERLQRASDVLARIPMLLREHAGCEKIVVLLGSMRLFAVDCRGNALPN
jgi:hypothetical protein